MVPGIAGPTDDPGKLLSGKPVTLTCRNESSFKVQPYTRRLKQGDSNKDSNKGKSLDFCSDCFVRMKVLYGDWLHLFR